MSLFLGNLSSHIRREELEHEFRRFGRSYIRLKDGYGFVVYEVPEDAERALRALRGKDICGEQISLSWSNRQPRSFQKFTRTNRFYGPHLGRNIRRGNKISRNRDTYDRREVATHPASNHRVPPLLNASNQEAGDAIEKTGYLGDEKDKRSNKGAPNDSFPADVNPVENDRWGKPIHNTLDVNGGEDDTVFERYEPKYDFDGRDVEEKQKESGFSASPAHIKSLDKGVREHSIDAHINHPENPKPKPVCYNCGLLGHIIRNCPTGTGTRLEKFNKFRGRKDDDTDFRGRGEEQPMRMKTGSWRRANTNREMSSLGHQAGGSRRSQSRKMKRLIGRESFTGNKENYCFKQRMEAQGRKRSKHGDRSPSKQHKKKPRSSSSYSSESSSRSHFQPSRSSFGRICHSHSRSSASLSHSSRSRSSSVSSECKTGIRQSKSRSTSSVSKSLSIRSDVKATPSKNNEINAANTSFPTSNQDHASSPRYGNLMSAELEVPGSNGALEVEVMDTSLIAGHLVHKGHLQDDDKTTQYSTDNVGIKKEASLAALDNISSISEKLQESIGEMADHEGSVSAKPCMHVVVGSDTHNCNSTRISLQEVHVALKHYGLQASEVCEPELSVESYFGGARLWPWEIIYYRRLKKGPISTKNYARRVAQNKQFGIIDKYVRSSSGWREF